MKIYIYPFFPRKYKSLREFINHVKNDPDYDWGETYKSWLYFTDFLGENLIGDLNSDQIINVVDIVSLVQNILNESEYICSYDLNQDTIINVVDIIALVGIILSSN